MAAAQDRVSAVEVIAEAVSPVGVEGAVVSGGACVVAVYARDVAETKATRATDAGRSKGYPLTFTTEPEE